jgi:hypothetical protein
MPKFYRLKNAGDEISREFRIQQYIVSLAKKHTTICGKKSSPDVTII